MVSLSLLSAVQRHRPDATWWTYAQPLVFSLAILGLGLALRQLWSAATAGLRLCPPQDRLRRYEDTWTLMALSFMAAVAVGMSVLAASLRASCALGAFAAGLSYAGLEPAASAWRRCARPCTRWLALAFFACSVGFAVPPAAWTDPRAVGRGLALAAAAFASRMLCSTALARAALSGGGGGGGGDGMLAAAQVGAFVASPGEPGFFILVELLRRGQVTSSSAEPVLWALLVSSAAGPALLRGLGGQAGRPAVVMEDEEKGELAVFKSAGTSGSPQVAAGAGGDGWANTAAILPAPGSSRRPLGGGGPAGGRGRRTRGQRPRQEIEPRPGPTGANGCGGGAAPTGAKALREALLSRTAAPGAAGSLSMAAAAAVAVTAAGLDDSVCSAVPLLRPGGGAGAGASDAKGGGWETGSEDGDCQWGEPEGDGSRLLTLDGSLSSDHRSDSDANGGDGGGGGGGGGGGDDDDSPDNAEPAALEPMGTDLDERPRPAASSEPAGGAGGDGEGAAVPDGFRAHPAANGGQPWPPWPAGMLKPVPLPGPRSAAAAGPASLAVYYAGPEPEPRRRAGPSSRSPSRVSGGSRPESREPAGPAAGGGGSEGAWGAPAPDGQRIPGPGSRPSEGSDPGGPRAGGGSGGGGGGWRAQSLARLTVQQHIAQQFPALWADSDDSDAGAEG